MPGIFSEFSLKVFQSWKKKVQCSVVWTKRLRRFLTQGFRHCGQRSRSTKWHKLPARLFGCTKWKRETRDRETWVGLKEQAVDCEPFHENREDLATLLSTADLAITLFRSEGFSINRLGNVIYWSAFSCNPKQRIWRDSAKCSSSEYPLGCMDSEESHKWAKAI